MDFKKIDNVELDFVETKDYPDFSDACIVAADYAGEPMTDEQLEEVNKNSSFVYLCVINQMT